MNSESWIVEEQKAAESDLRAMLGREPVLLERRQESLAVAGLESLVAMISLHAVTGVASGFTGKLLYGRWRDSSTRRKLNELAGQIPPLSNARDKVDENVIRRDVVEVLMLEGLTSDQAEYLTEQIVERVKSRAAEQDASNGRT